MSEPLFRNIQREDPEMEKAHALASNTASDFVFKVKEQADVAYMAKLRFRDPALSVQTGKDQFLYIWLAAVYHHQEENLLSGVFFEVPHELQKWHKVGERLGFEPEDMFDWMINDNGHVTGGYTLRVTRNRLRTEIEKQEFDEYSGISSYEPI